MSILIRAYQPSDREFILSLVSRFSEFALPEWRSKEEIEHASRISLQQALQQLVPDSAIFVAQDEDGTLAGFIHLEIQTDYFNNSKSGYISDLAVDKSFEGQGVGRVLLEAAEEWTRTQGCQLLTLYVFAGNLHPRQAYERYGFKQEVIKYVKPI